MLIEWLAEGK